MVVVFEANSHDICEYNYRIRWAVFSNAPTRSALVFAALSHPKDRIIRDMDFLIILMVISPFHGGAISLLNLIDGNQQLSNSLDEEVFFGPTGQKPLEKAIFLVETKTIPDLVKEIFRDACFVDQFASWFSFRNRTFKMADEGNNILPVSFHLH